MLMTRGAAKFSVTLLVLGVGCAAGQEYPGKPIRIVTGGAGGGTDFTSRLIAAGISGPLGQPVVIDNRGGAAAAENVAKSPPDGYSLLVLGSILWTGPLLRKMSYDPVADFSPIAIVSIEPNLLVVHPSLPAKTVKELIAVAKAKPGELNYASGGIGSSEQIAAELFNIMAGVKIQGIFYKSDSQQLTDLIGGYVHLSFLGGSKAGQHVKLNKLKALAVTTAQPSTLFPQLPTVAAAGGLPGFEAVAIIGIFAPAKAARPIINRLNQEIIRVLNNAEVKEKFFNAGVEVVGSTPEQLAATMKADMARMSKVIKDAGIKVE